MSNESQLHDLDKIENKEELKSNEELKDSLSIKWTDVNKNIGTTVNEELPQNELSEWKDFDIKEDVIVNVVSVSKLQLF